ncbi:hypothetical protein Leryth_003446 [Lithospermum erythrorhizon]|nr:hypothetical protein Leryth_003446 [Lithospermum erythrorhizon]
MQLYDLLHKKQKEFHGSSSCYHKDRIEKNGSSSCNLGIGKNASSSCNHKNSVENMVLVLAITKFQSSH